jgi:hypothetical protein
MLQRAKIEIVELGIAQLFAQNCHSGHLRGATEGL